MSIVDHRGRGIRAPTPRRLGIAVAARPGLDYDQRFGASPSWTGEMFIEAIQRSLAANLAAGRQRVTISG